MKPYTIQDPQGTRTLTYPDELLWTVGDPVGYTLHVEAATGTRLRTGESMLWFIRTFNDWERARAAGGTATFAEYVGRLHPGRVDVASSPAAGRAPREPGAAARRKQKNIRRAWELHQQGHTGEQIAMELGVSPAAVSGYLRLRAATGTDGGRRNLTLFQRAELALKLKPVIAAQAKENQKLSQGRGQKGFQNSGNLKHSDRALAEIAGVSHDSIYKARPVLAPSAASNLKFLQFLHM